MTEDQKNPTIFVVVGTTGEYSDRSEWLVVAYWRESDARAHAEAAKKWYLENSADKHWTEMGHSRNPYDPGMRCDYTGTDWTVTEVPFREGVEPFPVEEKP